MTMVKHYSTTLGHAVPGTMTKTTKNYSQQVYSYVKLNFKAGLFPCIFTRPIQVYKSKWTLDCDDYNPQS